MQYYDTAVDEPQQDTEPSLVWVSSNTQMPCNTPCMQQDVEIDQCELDNNVRSPHGMLCMDRAVHSWSKTCELAGQSVLCKTWGAQSKRTSPIFRADQGIIHRLRGIHRKHTNAYTMTTERKAALRMQAGASGVGCAGVRSL